MSKIKADSPEGIKALKHLEAERNYKGLNLLGMGTENYRNNPLEVEAYSFGDGIEQLIKDYIL